MNSEALQRARKKYNEKCKSIRIEFNPKEIYLFEYLQSQKNKNAFVKNLIKADFEQNKKEQE